MVIASPGHSSLANRALLDIMVAQPPFAGNVQVFDYDADTNPGFPHAKLAELGLAIYTPADAP